MKYRSSHRRRPRQSPHEQGPTTRQVLASQLGEQAIGHTSIVASLPEHRVGLQKLPGATPYDDPAYLESLRAEHAVIDTLDSATLDADFTPKAIGEQLLVSIDDETDSREVITLKQFTAKICGVENANLNYQTMITALDDSFTADELHDFISYVYEWSHEGKRDTEQYANDQMTALSGFRVEASFSKLALACGLTVQEATHFQDLHGMDFLVDGVPFDIKSSERTAVHHREKHQKNTNRFKVVTFVPPISAEDFHGRLVIPDEYVEGILVDTGFKEMVLNAIREFKVVNQLPA